MDLIITLAQTTDWDEYKKELDAVHDESQVMNFKLPSCPKSNPGDKCYLAYKGRIVGYMNVSGTAKGGFTCSTTGQEWEGNFIQRSGPFYEIPEEHTVPMAGFQSYRYVSGQPESVQRAIAHATEKAKARKRHS